MIKEPPKGLTRNLRPHEMFLQGQGILLEPLSMTWNPILVLFSEYPLSVVGLI